MKIKLCGALEYDEEIMHGVDSDDYRWFIQEVILGPNMSIIDSEVGDVIGTFTVDWYQEN